MNRPVIIVDTQLTRNSVANNFTAGERPLRSIQHNHSPTFRPCLPRDAGSRRCGSRPIALFTSGSVVRNVSMLDAVDFPRSPLSPSVRVTRSGFVKPASMRASKSSEVTPSRLLSVSPGLETGVVVSEVAASESGVFPNERIRFRTVHCLHLRRLRTTISIGTKFAKVLFERRRNREESEASDRTVSTLHRCRDRGTTRAMRSPVRRDTDPRQPGGFPVITDEPAHQARTPSPCGSRDAALGSGCSFRQQIDPLFFFFFVWLCPLTSVQYFAERQADTRTKSTTSPTTPDGRIQTEVVIGFLVTPCTRTEVRWRVVTAGEGTGPTPRDRSARPAAPR